MLIFLQRSLGNLSDLVVIFDGIICFRGSSELYLLKLLLLVIVVEDTFIATHALGLFLSKLLALLVPAPLINLSLGQIGLEAYIFKSLF